MRTLIHSFIICFLFVNYSLSQNYNWITPNKTYLKMYVNEDGMYRINKSDFTNAGVTSVIDPRTVKVFYNGNQIPVYFQGEEDGNFGDNDFIDFYGKRNYGGLTKYIDAYSNNTIYTVDQYYNLYSDTSIYWIGWDGSNGLRMQKSNYVSSVNFPDNYFYKKVHFEKDNFYRLGEVTNTSTDFRYFCTELVVGEGWFWQELGPDITNSLTENTFIDDLSSTTQLCSLFVFLKPNSYTVAVQNEHRVEIKINNTVIDTLFSDSLQIIDTSITFSSALLNNNSNNSVTLHYIPLQSVNFTARIYVDFFVMTYPRDFALRNNILQVNLTGTDSTSKKINISGYNSNNQMNIYDIKNGIRIDTFSNNGSTLAFSGKSNSSFQIINNNITKKPFKIINRQVRDLASVSNGADYLIVYNKLFESQAEQLRSHRESFDNFRSVKADIEDIYDIFNYGIENPVAVRNFVKYAYDNWTGSNVEYVCLFGRASLDPKHNEPTSQYYKNFVPTYGNPPSDGYFVNFNFGTYTYYHQISVGRVPVYTTVEAQNAVDKIVTYDLQPPDRWWKKYIAITGGGFRAEQINFQNQSDNYLNNYIIPPPPCMNVSRIYRNDSTGFITYDYKDSIKREFDRGSVLVNFIGHAAAEDWEIGLENPNTLNNGNKQPLILSFTCFTGRCSEPNRRSFGENFFLIPNKCAIGFIGTTGWSFSNTGGTYNRLVLENFSQDSVRRMGDLISYASQITASDSSSFSVRNTINSYNLIGDPATKLLIGSSPEFDIKQNDYTLSNPFPALGEDIKLSVFPKNLGTSADTVRIKFQLKKDGITIKTSDTLIGNMCFTDTLGYFFTIDTIGNYTMSVIIDPNKSYPQNNYGNDSITFPITLRNLSYVPVKPLDNAVITTAGFKFTGLNPNVSTQNNTVKLILQIDTTITFNSQIQQTFTKGNNNISGVSTNFDITLPVQELNTVYFIRTNAIVNNDSSGWSEIQRVIYNPNVSDEKNTADSAYTIYTKSPNQFSENELQNVKYDGNGFILSNFTGNISVRSYGSNGPEASFITVNNGINNITYYSDGGGNHGLNIGKVKRLTGNVPDIKNFRMTTPESSDSVIAFLNTFDASDYMVLYMTGNVFGPPPNYECESDTLSNSAKAKLRQFGSIYADSIFNFCRFTTWAFIGYLGADTSKTCEGYHDYFSNNTWEQQNCIINPVFQRTSGKISQTFGTADRWKNFSWDQTLAANSFITFDVYGLSRADNSPELLYTDLSVNTQVNLDTIDYYTYPNLRLDANLKIDTVNGLQSPLFKSTTFRYFPPAELLPDNNSFKGSDTVVQEGDSVSFSVNYYNVGYIDAPKYYSKWYVKNQGTEIVLQQDTIDTPLLIDSMKTSYVKFSTSGLRNVKVLSDTIDLYFETNLVGNKNELFDYNNAAITQFTVQGDTISPVMQVTYDGVKIINGDYIQSNPEIVLNFLDDSRMVIQDTTNLRVFNFINNSFSYVPYYINGIKNPVINITFPDNNFLQATVTYNPSLDQGVHKFRYVAVDVTGNFADTIINSVVVDNNLSITEMANYPNPMKTETNFMFKLSGESNPTTCKVKIFTVAGRLIKEINANAIVGYNNISWDGKDNDGDYIANGTYLYKFIIEGNSQVETSIQKLAVLR